MPGLEPGPALVSSDNPRPSAPIEARCGSGCCRARRELHSPSLRSRVWNVTPSPRREKKRARIGAQQIESNESSPCLRSSEDANNVGASVPPLRAGHVEMKARVDCGYADPPCVCALLCRWSGTWWWKKGSQQKTRRVWLEYSRHPWRSRASARTARRRGNRTVSASPPGIARSTDTTIRRRDAGLRLADRDSYAIGWATGEPLGFLKL